MRISPKVGMAALKEEASLRSVADEFDLQLIQVLIWRTKCASEKTPILLSQL